MLFLLVLSGERWVEGGLLVVSFYFLYSMLIPADTHADNQKGRKYDTRNSLARLEGTFERLVKARGPLGAVRGIMGLVGGID